MAKKRSPESQFLSGGAKAALGGAKSAPIEVPVEMKDQKESWSEVNLVDGTKVRFKPIAMAVTKTEGVYQPDGQPQYNVRFTMVFDVDSPMHLRKK